MKFPVKNVEIVWKISGLALSSSQTQGFDRILKIFIKSLFFIKLEVNDDKTGLLFVPLSTLSKPEGTHHPLSRDVQTNVNAVPYLDFPIFRAERK